MSTGAFHPDFSLAVLETQLNAFLPLWGGLSRITNDGRNTIGVYDRAKPKLAISLRPGQPDAAASGTVISTGQVFIANQLQTVTAYGR